MRAQNLHPDSPARPEHQFDGAALPYILAESGGAASCDRGVKNLMIAVLEDGIRCFLGKREEDRLEAEEWMTSEDEGFVFDFKTLCVTLDLDPIAVHESLVALRERQGYVPARQIRTRTNHRRRGAIRPNRVRRRNQAANAGDAEVSAPLQASAA